jgi:hypothetical protein
MMMISPNRSKKCSGETRHPQEALHLRDGEDDDEVEEQLQGRDPLLVVRLIVCTGSSRYAL